MVWLCVCGTAPTPACRVCVLFVCLVCRCVPTHIWSKRSQVQDHLMLFPHLATVLPSSPGLEPQLQWCTSGSRGAPTLRTGFPQGPRDPLRKGPERPAPVCLQPASVPHGGPVWVPWVGWVPSEQSAKCEVIRSWDCYPQVLTLQGYV